VSRLTDLLRQAKEKDPQLGADLEREFKVISGRLAFGLNFERHRPEAVELPHRPVRKGDKVRLLPERGSTKKGDRRLWRVTQIQRSAGEHTARLSPLGPAESKEKLAHVGDCVVVAEFRDRIYPGLAATGKVERGGDKPFHTVINGENFHVLEALTYTHKGRVDCIYIDPPYNTGARDWKYNNDYVEATDLYRHSKWLAMMERRLKLAKQLLNPDDSVLVVTIDEKEYLRLGLLLEQVFPEANIQMVSSAINATGAIRANEFTRTNEFIFFVLFGFIRILPETSAEAGEAVPWNLLQRREMPSRRGGPQPGPDQFYPIYVNQKSGRIEYIGDPIPLGVPREVAPKRPGCVTVFPLKPDGTEMNWGLTPASLQALVSKGFARAVRARAVRARPTGSVKFTIYYLTTGKVRAIESGQAVVESRRDDGSVVATYVAGQATMPSTIWQRESHNAQSHGTKLLSKLTPGRKFPYPKSLYAVEDALRFMIGNKREAVVLDFFAGSGTTAHAVMRLNHQDNGRRCCILPGTKRVPTERSLLAPTSAAKGGSRGPHRSQARPRTTTVAINRHGSRQHAVRAEEPGEQLRSDKGVHNVGNMAGRHAPRRISVFTQDSAFKNLHNPQADQEFGRLLVSHDHASVGGARADRLESMAARSG
jgi:adenine-specific DNA-methyltransferase